MSSASEQAYGQSTAWQPERPRFRVFPLLVSWLATGVALMVAAAILPGVSVNNFWGALVVAAVVAALNAVIPPVLAALRLPLTLVLGFLVVLVADALILQIAAELRVTEGAFSVDNFGWALLAALVVAAVSVVLAVILGSDDMSSIRIAQRIAKRQGIIASTDVPGIIYLEIDGLALPGAAPGDARRQRPEHGPLAGRGHASPGRVGDGSLLADGCEPGGDPARLERGHLGLPLGGEGNGDDDDLLGAAGLRRDRAAAWNRHRPARRRRRQPRQPALGRGGGRDPHRQPDGGGEEVQPGYRAFFANGDNALRTLVLFGWEVILEWTAALRAIRRDVHPRGHRGGIYPLMRGALCVFVRDLIVSGVLTDIMRGRPAVYATFSSYDEVAHHSGLERADTLEALRKLDDKFAEIERALRYAPRPYEIVVLSDHGQTQGATFKQRNGYGLDELVERSLAQGDVEGIAGGDEQSSMVGNAVSEATGKKPKRPKNDVSDRDVVVLGSGNLGLVYLMEERRRLTLEEIDERHPELVPALRAHPHVGWLLVRSAEHGAVALGASGTHYLADGRVEGEDPLAPFSTHRTPAPAAHRRLRARRRHHGRELLRP